MLIVVPLTPMSAKILATEYGRSPITPGRADWLSDVLRIDRSSTRFTPEEEAAVSSGVLLNVSPKVASQIERQGKRLGVVIHRLHLENLSRHMAACSMRFPTKGLAMVALRDFYDYYGLSDDDFSQESAYREYSRFRKKFLANSATNSRHRVRPESRIWQQRDNQVEHINQAGLDVLCRVLDDRLRQARIRRREVLARHAYIYIYAVRGGRDIAEISRRFKKHRANVYRAISHIQGKMKSDARFARILGPILSPAFVLPAPSQATDICSDKGSGQGTLLSGTYQAQSDGYAPQKTGLNAAPLSSSNPLY